MLAVGLMSGTSLDGIDAVLVEIEPRAGGYSLRTIDAALVPFEHGLSARLRACVPPAAPGPATVAGVDVELGAALADAVRSVAGARPIDFIASHGVTLFHDGDRCITWQIGNPFVVRERTGVTVLYDFRRADCAAGGHGAPLVPFADALFFAGSAGFRAAINLGGIANVTLLPPNGRPADAVAWDVGPGNMLIDGFVAARTAGLERCDRDGRYAARGSVDRNALRTLEADPYFAQSPPKSTGRERFGKHFLAAHAAALDPLSLEDGCATLTALTARTVGAAIVQHASGPGEAIVSGGGIHNPALRKALAEQVPGFEVVSSERFGIDPDYKEACAFALLGYELLRGREAGLPRVTGAQRSTLLGAIVPEKLDGLLARVCEELRTAAKQET